jgi:nucleoside-diphosphate-sugar epimerase
MATEFDQDRSTVLVVGGTGYVGGSVIHALMKHPEKEFSITAVTPNADEASKLQEMGVRPVVANLDDTGVLESEAARHHVSFLRRLFRCIKFAPHFCSVVHVRMPR